MVEDSCKASILIHVFDYVSQEMHFRTWTRNSAVIINILPHIPEWVSCLFIDLIPFYIAALVIKDECIYICRCSRAMHDTISDIHSH